MNPSRCRNQLSSVFSKSSSAACRSGDSLRIWLGSLGSISLFGCLLATTPVYWPFDGIGSVAWICLWLVILGTPIICVPGQLANHQRSELELTSVLSWSGLFVCF